MAKFDNIWYKVSPIGRFKKKVKMHELLWNLNKLPLLALSYYHLGYIILYIIYMTCNGGALTLDVKLVLNKNLSWILDGAQC